MNGPSTSSGHGYSRPRTRIFEAQTRYSKLRTRIASPRQEHLRGTRFCGTADPDRLQLTAPCSRKDAFHRDRNPSLQRPTRWVDRPRFAGRGHRSCAGRRRRPEGGQRPPRHRHEPGSGGVPAVPEGDAAQSGRPALAGPRPVRAVLRPLQPDAVHPALPRRVRPRAGRPQVPADLELQDPGPPRVRPHPRRGDHHRPARARASPTRSAWPWPPAGSAACSIPTPLRANRSSTTRSTAWPPTATSRRASPPRRPRWPVRSASATSP